MKHICTILTVIFAASLAFGQTNSPSLEDTIAWMDNTYNHSGRGFVVQSERHTNHWSFEETSRFTYSQGRMVLIQVEPGDTNWRGGSPVGKWATYDFSFNLRDIDPTTIHVQPLSSIYMSDCTNPEEARELGDCGSQAEVQFSIRDEQRLIQKVTTTWEKFPLGTTHDDIGTTSYKETCA